MTQPAFLDIDELIAPISPGDPVGEYLRWEDEYLELEEARRADDDAGDDGVWSRQKKTADWRGLTQLGTRLLREKTKDLQIAAWIAEALTHQHGLAGARDGFKLILALQEAYWDTAHPDHGDLEFREGVYEFLDHERLIPLLVKSAPLTFVPGAPDLSYSFLGHEESRQAENLARRHFDDEDEKAEHLAGMLRAEQFDTAFEATSREFYVELAELVDECLGLVEQINQGIESRWKAETYPPRLGATVKALEDVRKLVGQLLARKPAEEPPAVEDEEPEEETEDADESWDERENDEAEDESEAEAHDDRTEQPDAAPRPRSRRARPAELDSPEDARRVIAEAAHFLRQADQADPTSYLVLRALALGGTLQSDDLDPANLPAPASETREKLFQYSRVDDYESLEASLEESERALGGPEGWGWLDLHWYSRRALEGLGHDKAARASAALLKAGLERSPEWPRASLRDGTPCASPSAIAWLQEEGLLEDGEAAPSLLNFAATPPEPEPDAPAAEADSPTPPQDPWDQAQELLKAGDVAGSLAIMAKAARQASSGRERFIRALQQAELCIALDRSALATPILEGLAARVDQLRLDEWEEASLCARVFSNLYQCLRGRDDERAEVVHRRLCQLDIGVALQMEGS